MVDGFGRKVNYLRLSVTDLCNLRCRYCMPESGVSKICHQDILSFEEIDAIVDAFIELGITKIRVTGGEPLVRKDILYLLERIGRHPRITDFAITTNGIFLKSMAKKLKEVGVNRVNISLDSLDEAKFANMTRGGSLKDVLEGIETAIQIGLTPIKLNVVLIGGFNDDEIEDFVRLTKDNEIDVRFIELMPIGEVANWSLDHFIPNSYVLEKVGSLTKVEEIEVGSPAVYYKLPNSKGRVGLISPISCKFCDDCNRVRVTSEGILKYCLHSNEEFDLKRVLREEGSLTEFIQKVILEKPFEHSIEKGEFVKRNMARVGG